MPLPSNGALMGSNGLPVWLGNRLECLLALDDPVSPSSLADNFTCQCLFVIAASSRISVCSSALSQIFVFPLQQGGSRYWIILIIYKIGYNRTGG